MKGQSKARPANRSSLDDAGERSGSMLHVVGVSNDNGTAALLQAVLPLATLLRAEIRAEIRAGVAEVLDAQAPEITWRDSAAECQRLGVSRPTLDRLVTRGMPHVYIGDSRRFRAVAVDAWLVADSAARKAGGAR